MANWFMLSVVGKDRPAIVAAVTTALYEGGCQLGEASMMRLGGNFAMMLMVQHRGDPAALRALLEPVETEMDLHVHVDGISGELHHHVVPDVTITVFGADRPGIVAQVTSALARAGLNILDLTSDVAGTEEKPIYLMQIEGSATRGIGALESALGTVRDQGIETRIAPVEPMVG